MEATVEKYKRRMEDMAGLRQQVKELDDLNSKYLDQVQTKMLTGCHVWLFSFDM